MSTDQTTPTTTPTATTPTLSPQAQSAMQEAIHRFETQGVPIDQFVQGALNSATYVINDIDGRDKTGADGKPVLDGVLTRDGVIASYRAFIAHNTEGRPQSADQQAIANETIAVLSAKLPENFTITQQALTAAITNVATTWNKDGNKVLSRDEINAGKDSGITLFTAIASVSPRGNEILGDLEAIQRAHAKPKAAAVAPN